MPKLDERLLRLDSVLDKLERVEAERTIETLEERLRKLESGSHHQAPTREPAAPEPTQGFEFGASAKTILTAALALVVPISTVLYGQIERRRQQLETEHEIVKTHLGDVLEGDPTDPYDLNHLRHLRFLRRLAPQDEPPDTDDLKAILGTWADEEYQLKLRQIERKSKGLTNRINDQRVEIERLEMKLQVERGWYLVEYDKWQRTTPPRDEQLHATISQLRATITTSFERKDAQIDELRTNLQSDENDWETLMIARSTTSTFARPPLEPIEYLERQCEGRELGSQELSYSKRLAACTQAGSLYYTKALLALDEDPDVEQLDLWFRSANDHFERACDAKWAKACKLLSDSYRRGHVRSPQRQQALTPRYQIERELIEEAESLGLPDGANGLGWYYLQGEGVPEDKERARELFDRSCRLGSLNGCDSLGTWYQREQDLEEAELWFTHACEGDEIRGCVNHINLLLELNSSDFATLQPSTGLSTELDSSLNPPENRATSTHDASDSN